MHSNRIRAENFRMVNIGINAWSSLFDNLKINIILQDYLKSVWKTVIIRETAAATREEQTTNERTEIFSLEKTINRYPRREKKGGLGQKWKVSTVDIRIKKSGLKFIHSKVPSSEHIHGNREYIYVQKARVQWNYCEKIKFS